MGSEKNTLIENGSGEDVNVVLSQVETKLVDPNEPSLKLIERGKKIQYQVSFPGGCSRMFVFGNYASPADKSNKLLWSGIIPLGGSFPITITKDKQGNIEILAADGKIPEAPEISIGLRGKENFTPTKKEEKPTWWWVLLFITILFGVFLIKNYYI